MKISQKNRAKKEENNKKSLLKPIKQDVLIVAQEIKFARSLSSNEKKIRDRALKTLKKWLLNCFQKGYVFKEEDFQRIWKGLFYAVWMSDKPLVQEELCENIAGLLDVFPPEHFEDVLLMVKVGLRAIASEWYGIDQHRIDKCLMLVRRYLRGSLRCLARSDWSMSACTKYTEMLTAGDSILALKTPMFARNATSMIIHFIDCFLEELAKVANGKIPGESVAELVRPFCSYMCLGSWEPICASCRRLLTSLLRQSDAGVSYQHKTQAWKQSQSIGLPMQAAELVRPFCSYMCLGSWEPICAACRRLLTSLLRQSDAGVSYQHKTQAWKQMGCPEGGPDALELVSDEEGNSSEDEDQEEETQTELDPRAGRCDVILQPLPVCATAIVSILKPLRAVSNSRRHRRVAIALQRFEQLAKDEYPLKVQEVSFDHGPKLPKTADAARSLQALDEKLAGTSDELALRGLSRKRRKKLLAKSRAGLSIVDDAIAATKNNAAGDWQVEETQPKPKKMKNQNVTDKENRKKKVEKRKIESHNEVAPKKQKTDARKNTAPVEKLQKQKTVTVDKAPSKLKEKQSITNEETPKKTVLTVKKQPKIKNKPNGDAKTQKTSPTLVVKKVKSFQKQLSPKIDKNSVHTPKKVKFVLKNNSKQETIDYYKSVRQSPKIPFDSHKIPSKTNLKPSTPSPINPFFKKKWKITN